MYKHHCSRQWNCSIYFLIDHETEHCHCYELWFAYCNTCDWIFSPLKPGNRLNKQVRKVARVKHGFFELVLIILIFWVWIQDVIVWFLLILLMQHHQHKLINTYSFYSHLRVPSRDCFKSVASRKKGIFLNMSVKPFLKN